MKKLIASMLLIGLALCLTATAEPAPKVGSESPALQLTSLNGKLIKLESFRGEKKVILSFFASWSESCRQELEALREFQANNAGSLEVLAVSFDKKARDLKNYAAKADLPFPILLDKKLSSIDTFQILILPTTFCISREGMIEKIFVDYDDNVKKAIEEWLKS